MPTTKICSGSPPVLGCVALEPGDCGSDVARTLWPLRIRRETIAAVDADISEAREIVRDVCRSRAAASDKAAAVEHEDYGRGTLGPPHRRGVNVDLLPLVRAVGEILRDLDFARFVDTRLRRIDLRRLSGNLAVELGPERGKLCATSGGMPVRTTFALLIVRSSGNDQRNDCRACCASSQRSSVTSRRR